MAPSSSKTRKREASLSSCLAASASAMMPLARPGVNCRQTVSGRLSFPPSANSQKKAELVSQEPTPTLLRNGQQ